VLNDLIKTSIDLIQAYEPPEGYYVAFSGGKDSVVTLDLVKKSGVKYTVHHNLTGIDPPELVRFIRQNFPDMVYELPKVSFAKGIIQNGLPNRFNRWCCRTLKERGGKKRVRITGIRAGESLSRKARNCQEVARDGGHFVHPIFRWSTADVWQYVHDNNLPYCCLYDEGFERIGCAMCPFGGNKRYRDMIRWPKIAAIWYRGAVRYWEKQTPAMAKFATADDYWGWWLSGRRNAPRLIGGDVVKPIMPKETEV
jgi:phosphoadenosine phosphosulfate reductase